MDYTMVVQTGRGQGQHILARCRAKAGGANCLPVWDAMQRGQRWRGVPWRVGGQDAAIVRTPPLVGRRRAVAAAARVSPVSHPQV
jgi:hypothetical protein